MTQEEIDHIIDTVTPDVLEKELIQDGTGLNYRNKKLQYIAAEGVVHQDFSYAAPANASNWSQVKSVVAYEAQAETITVYRTWDISNHPVDTDVTRQVHLVKLGVDKEKIQLWLKVTHSANYADRVMYKYGDDASTMVVGVDANGDPIIMGEREGWDYLTNQGNTPYHLLDQRIPEMDSQGMFNNIY